MTNNYDGLPCRYGDPTTADRRSTRGDTCLETCWGGDDRFYFSIISNMDNVVGFSDERPPQLDLSLNEATQLALDLLRACRVIEKKKKLPPLQNMQWSDKDQAYTKPMAD